MDLQRLRQKVLSVLGPHKAGHEENDIAPMRWR